MKVKVKVSVVKKVIVVSMVDSDVVVIVLTGNTVVDVVLTVLIANVVVNVSAEAFGIRLGRMAAVSIKSGNESPNIFITCDRWLGRLRIIKRFVYTVHRIYV